MPSIISGKNLKFDLYYLLYYLICSCNQSPLNFKFQVINFNSVLCVKHMVHVQQLIELHCQLLPHQLGRGRGWSEVVIVIVIVLESGEDGEPQLQLELDQNHNMFHVLSISYTHSLWILELTFSAKQLAN